MQSTDKQEASKRDATRKLNDLLRGEMSAYETYGKALESVKECSCTTQLETAMACHKKRSQVIAAKVKAMGAEPSETSGGWGTFSNSMEAEAGIFGEKAAINMLEEGEDYGLKQYKELWKDSNSTVSKVIQDFLPKQQETHRVMKDLKAKLQAK
ncbi:DUF2383 domain-containing protein [bacterium]|nr:DUF2383 domain-containing protein [bacterium]